MIFACNDSKKGDTAYFARLAVHLARDDVARAFYQYLRDDVDVSPFTPFQAHRPRTEAYFAMQRRNISPFYKFLSFKIIQDDSPGRAVKIMAAEFFAEFQSWCARGYTTSQGHTIASFGQQLKSLIADLVAKDPNQGILTKKKVCNQIDKGQQYTVHWAKLQTHLESAHLFDSDAAG